MPADDNFVLVYKFGTHHHTSNATLLPTSLVGLVPVNTIPFNLLSGRLQPVFEGWITV